MDNPSTINVKFQLKLTNDLNIPDGALFVELLDLLVDEGLRVLPLVLGPARLQEHAVGRVGLLAAALRHPLSLVVFLTFIDRTSLSKAVFDLKVMLKLGF